MAKNTSPLEKDEQKRFIKYSKDLYPLFPSLEYLLIATMSGSWLHGSEAQRERQVASEKAQGRKNGVADILCLMPMGEYSGLAIEMKRQKGGTVSQAQKDWLATAESNGWYAVVARGADEAIDALNYYLGVS